MLKRFGKSSKMTIDKLAIMVAKGFENVATKEDLKKQNDTSQIMLKEIKTIHEDNKYFRASISNLNIDGLSYERKIDNLTIRMEKVESKLK